MLLTAQSTAAALEFEGRSPKTPDECARVWSLAKQAAQAAAEIENMRLGDERSRGFDCGFAWVVIAPATQPFAKWTKKFGISSKHYAGGQCIWYSNLHSLPTQSVSVHQAAAQAAADVLQRANIKAYTGSRLD
jgi:predicted esterase YcpF (UPF0227 family)